MRIGFSSGAHLAAFRRNARLSVKELAAAVGCAPELIERAEATERLLKGRVSRKLRRYLDSIGADVLPTTIWLGGPIRGHHHVARFSIDADTPCGAMTRSGRQCRCTITYRNGRCKWHGGFSSGPKTETGREAISIAQRERWARYRETKRSVASPQPTA